MPLKLTSPVFEDGGVIPAKYTGKSDNVSPPLRWEGEPEGVKSYALMVDDPDAPGGKPFVHWMLYNLPSDVHALQEHLPPEPTFECGPKEGKHARQGKNDFDRIGFHGPEPPTGESHQYNFTLYALDCTVSAPPGAAKEELLADIQDHILEQAELRGFYGVQH